MTILDRILILAVIILSLNSCRISYSFSGASISPETKTVSIQYFQNQAPLFQPTLSNTFTEALKDRMTSQTSLELVSSSGDLNFEGEITNYSSNPLAIQGNETAALNRLSITVRVKFTNEKDSKFSFDRQFTQFTDYESSKSLSSVENELILTIVEKLTEDIYNAALTNW